MGLAWCGKYPADVHCMRMPEPVARVVLEVVQTWPPLQTVQTLLRLEGGTDLGRTPDRGGRVECYVAYPARHKYN